jgi:hypothetical protein
MEISKIINQLPEKASLLEDAPPLEVPACLEAAGNVTVNRQSREDFGQMLAEMQLKWSPEDRKLIELRGKGMKWEDMSENPPGKSALSGQLHYQIDLEKVEQDEMDKDRLARLYARYVK